METMFNFLEATTAFEFAVVSTIALAVILMLSVIIWEVLSALDRATRLIIKIVYVPFSWVSYKVAQLLVLAFVAAATILMFNPQIQYELYWKLRRI